MRQPYALLGAQKIPVFPFILVHFSLILFERVQGKLFLRRVYKNRSKTYKKFISTLFFGFKIESRGEILRLWRFLLKF